MPTRDYRGAPANSCKFNRGMDCRVKPGNDALKVDAT
jgi:hypothetical protein